MAAIGPLSYVPWINHVIPEAIWTAHELITNFCADCKTELEARWENWKLDHAQLEVHEVVGALLARQVTLATSLAKSRSLWNWSMAPVVLRPMTEVYLNLAAGGVESD